MIAGPWGSAFEYNFGKLRSNDSHDMGIVDSDSIYRIARVSKVYRFFSTLILGRDCFGDAPFAGEWTTIASVNRDLGIPHNV